jgi:hypothetical protein
MSTEPPPVTMFEVVRRAVQLIDPDDNDPTAGDFERAFEDDDTPIRGVEGVEARVGEVLAELDPATTNGGIAMAGALTVYLAYRRDEVNVDPAKLLVLAARAEWDGAPPEPVVEWLADRGLKV